MSGNNQYPKKSISPYIKFLQLLLFLSISIKGVAFEPTIYHWGGWVDYFWCNGGNWCYGFPCNSHAAPNKKDSAYFDIPYAGVYNITLHSCTMPVLYQVKVNQSVNLDLAGIAMSTSDEFVVGEGTSETVKLRVDDTVGNGSLTVGTLNIGKYGTGDVTITNNSDVKTKGIIMGIKEDIQGERIGIGYLHLSESGWVDSSGNIVAGEDAPGYGSISLETNGSISDVKTKGIIMGIKEDIQGERIGIGYLHLSESGWVDSSGNIVAGEDAPGYGSISLETNGSITTGTKLIIGNEGNADMMLSEGSTAESNDLIVGQAAASTGNIQVINSEIVVNDEMIVGDAGQGGMTINAGGIVWVGNNAVVGHDVNSSGTVTVMGYRLVYPCKPPQICMPNKYCSFLNIGENIYIGSKGIGNLYIQNEGQVTCNGEAYISYPHDNSNTYSGKGVVEVSGGNSLFEVASTLQVGGGNDGLPYPNKYSVGRLSIKNGGLVTAENVMIKLPNLVSLDEGNIAVSENGNVTLEQGVWAGLQARLVGYGTVYGNIVNHGLVQPGKINVGPLTVNGNYTQDGTNTTPTLLISILGNEENKFNKLVVTGTAVFGTNNGPAVKIKFDIPNGSSLKNGDSIDIVSATGGISMNSFSFECPSGWSCTYSLVNSETTLKVTFSSSGGSGSVVNLGWLVKGNSPSEPIQYVDNNGDVHAFISYSRENYHEYPSQLLDVNLSCGSTTATPVDGPTGKVGMPLRHSNGMLYIPSMHSVEWPNYTEYHGMVGEFDPLSGEMTRQWPTSDAAVYCMIEGNDGKIYIGGGTKGYLNILDPETGVMTNFGIVDDPQCGSSGKLCTGYYRYVDSLGADENYIYVVIRDVNTECGTTLQWSSYLVRIDQHTFDQKIWPSDCTDNNCENWKKCGSATSLAVKRVESTTGTCSDLGNSTWALESTISSVVSLFYIDSAGEPQLVCSSGCDTYSSCLKNNMWEIKNVLPCYKYSYEICGDHYFTDNGFKIHVTKVAPTETCDGNGNLDVEINYWPIDPSCNLGNLTTCTSDASEFLLDPMPITGLYSDPTNVSKLFGFAYSTGPIYGPFFWIDDITGNPIHISSKGYFYRSIYDALYDSSIYGSGRVFVSGYAGPTAATMVYNPSQSWTLDREDDLYTNPTGINPSPVPLTGLSKYHLHQAVGSNGLLYLGCDLNRDNPVGGVGGGVLRAVDPLNSGSTSGDGCVAPNNCSENTAINCRYTDVFNTNDAPIYQIEDMISVSSGSNIVVSCNGKLSTQLGKLFIYDSDDRCDLPGDQPSCPTLESTKQESGKLIEVGTDLVFGMTETDYYLADIGSSPDYLYRYDLPHVTINSVSHPYTAFGSTLDYFRRAHLVKDSSNRVYFLLEHTDASNNKIIDLCRIDPDSNCCNNATCGSGPYSLKPCIEKLLSNIGDPGYLVFKGNDLYLYGFSSGVIKKIASATSLTGEYICPAIEYHTTNCQ